MNTTIGTCGNCGGRVSAPSDWMATIPPTPTCEQCGATAREDYETPIPMKPRPTRTQLIVENIDDALAYRKNDQL